MIDTWYGFERGDDGRLQFMFTWEPNAAGAALRSRPQVVMLKVSTPQGAHAVRARDPRHRAARRGRHRGSRARSPCRPGRMQLDLSVRGADGSVIDTGAQDIDVPVVRGAGPVLLQPQLVRARTARDFRTLSAQADAAPTPSRTFSRSERLLIRVPAYNPGRRRRDDLGVGLEHQGRHDPRPRSGSGGRAARRSSICRSPFSRPASTASRSR